MLSEKKILNETKNNTPPPPPPPFKLNGRSLMDLFNAFVCLPHDISLDKLSAYGMSTDSVSLLESYLSNRKPQIKVNSILSSWSDIQKGVPQGSIVVLYFLMSLLMIFFILLKRVLYIIMRMTILCLMVILILMYLPPF